MSDEVSGRVASDLCDQLGLVERLRGYADGPSVAPDDALNEAADEIVRLRGLLERAAVDVVRADNERAQIVAAEREATRQRIVDACGSLLMCPCCGEQFECADDCTFATDCPIEAETLQCLRDAMRA